MQPERIEEEALIRKMERRIEDIIRDVSIDRLWIVEEAMEDIMEKNNKISIRQLYEGLIDANRDYYRYMSRTD